MFGLLFSIFVEVTLPIVLLIALGFIAQRWQKLDAGTLNRLVVYALLPPFMIHALAQPSVPLSQMGEAAILMAGQSLLLLALGWGLAKMARLSPAQCGVVAFGVAFPNSVNFGIPFVDLALGADQVAPQAVAGSIHSVVMMTLGLVVLSGGESGILRGFLRTLKSPIFPALAIGLALRLTDTTLPHAIAYPLALVGQGYAPLALVTLGVQLAVVRWSASFKPLSLAVVAALVIAPAATWGLIWLGGLAKMTPSAEMTALLIVNAALPAGALLAILGAQYSRDKVLPTAFVVASTVLSPITLTVTVFLMRRYGLI